MIIPDENPSTSRRWDRPIPRIGDTTSSATRAADPTGWSLGDQVQQGLDIAIDTRRDIRRYRHDDIPEELVNTVLWAGHRAPSVGHSQPWRFIVVRDADIRDRAAVMADRERLRQADLLTADRKARLLDLQLEGIREAPVGVVVACDRRAPASGVLGRNTFTDADMWSCACAVENMWLTARVYGLGMGWVTLFQPEELAELLHLPNDVETLGWLCLGWPDERPPAPGLERRGWSRRVPLSDVTLADRWPADSAQPEAPVSALRQTLHSPNRYQVVAAHDDADQLLTPPGSLGLLDQTLDRVEAVLDAGHRVFGENYVQEAQGKWPGWRAHYPGVDLHMIGPLQSNKAKAALDLFDAIHTLDRMTLARKLAQQIAQGARHPQLFIQVNTGDEPQKAGILADELPVFLSSCRDLGLSPQGLMCIPPEGHDPLPHFRLLHRLAADHGLPNLSMGMSADLEAAVRAGATQVRIGSDVLGARDAVG